jgi:WD40 repeat protein
MSDAVLLREEAIGHSVHSLAYSPDGTHLAYGLNNRTVYVMRIADAAYVASFEAHTAECLAFSPDSQTLASASTFDSSIRLWRMSDHGQALSLPARGVREIAFAPDGKSLAWAGAGGQVVVYSLPGGNVVRQLPATPTLMVGMNTVAYTPDGYLLVAASSDLRVHAWRAGDGLEIGHVTLAKMWMGGVRALALAPRDGRMAIGGGGPVLQLWRYAVPTA